MTAEKSIVRVWGAETPKIEQRSKTKVRKPSFEQFVRNHMVTVILLAAMFLDGVIVGGSTAHNVRKETEERLAAEYAAKLEEYKAEQARSVQAEYFLSGEASREAFINQEAEALVKDGGVWKNDKAMYTFWGSVVARVMNSAYPNTVREVLAQKGQYDFWSENNKIDNTKFQKAKEFLTEFYDGYIPADLSKDHVYIEMRDGGNDCVLHTQYGGGKNDDPWRYHG